TTTNQSAETQRDFNAGSLTSNDGTSQDGMVMPIWKDPSHYETASINENDDAPEFDGRTNLLFGPTSKTKRWEN
ncbi:hypothetical protein Tco_0350383, partial [Tanacetum coccineum]